MLASNNVGSACRLLSAAVVLAGLFAHSAASAESGPSRVDKTSKGSFSETIAKLESALKAEHMMVVAKIDHARMLSMVGAKIRGATTVEFGKPDMGKMLLPMNPAIGLEMPARIYVYERGDGTVVVSYRRVAQDFAAYGSPDVAKAGEMMDMMADEIATAAAQ